MKNKLQKKMTNIIMALCAVFFLTAGISLAAVDEWTRMSGDKQTESEGDWYHWDDGIPTHRSGDIDGGTLTVATLWKSSDLIGKGQIIKIRVGVGTLPSNAVIKIWQGHDLDSMELQYSQIFIPLAEQINEVVLDSPYVIDGSQDLILGWSATHNEGEYPCYHDAATNPNQQGDLLLGEKSGEWQHFANEGDWIIHAFINNKPCLSDADCDDGVCTAGNICVECEDNVDCADDEICDDDLCVADCPQDIRLWDEDGNCLLNKDELKNYSTTLKNQQKAEKTALKEKQAAEKDVYKEIKKSEYAE